eukprot:gene25625-32101_t
MRVIALSATLPNLADIGDWIGCEPHSVHYFDDSFRPVPLTIHTLAMGNMNNPFLFERSLDEKVGDIVSRYSDGKQTLIFCSSKKSTETLAALLARKQMYNRHQGNNRDLEQWTQSVQDVQLRELIRVGFAYHHGGLPPDDRSIVEQLYLSGHIRVLCSTSTLAHGVNLPAHLVVIKGTNCWRGGSRGYEKMCRSEIIQMLGRAGRPGFDNNGVAVIMTSSQDRDYYAAMSLSAEVVESTLQGILIEAICSEITQHVIQNLSECLRWIKSTFFYIRVRKNPKKYGFAEALGQTSNPEQYFDKMLVDICTAAIKQLSAAGIVELGENTTLLEVQPKPEAHIMTRNLINFDMMQMLIKLSATLTLAQLLRDFSKSKELSKTLRKQEKRILNDFMKTVRFPLKDRVQDPWHKSYVLMQAAVSRLEIKDFALRVEQSEIVESGLRVLSALAELCKANGSGPLLESTILLDRALRCRMWEYNYGSVFVQCPGLTDATRNGLVLRGVRSVNDLEGCSLSKLQDMAQCSGMEAREIMQFAQLLRVSRMVLRIRVDASSQLVIDVDPAQSEAPQTGTFSTDQLPSYQLLAYDTRTSEVLCYRKIGSASVGQHTSFSVPLSKQGGGLENVRCCLLATLIGNDCVQGSAATVGGMTIQQAPPRAVQKSTTATNKSSAQASVVSASSGKVPQGRVPRAANPSSMPAPTTLSYQVSQSSQQPMQQTQSAPAPPSKMMASVSRAVPSFEDSLQRFALRESENVNDLFPSQADNFTQQQSMTQQQQQQPRMQRTQLGPANISSSATNATVPGISRELFVLRSKAAEMNFDGQQGIKRMRPSFQQQPASQQIRQEGYTYNAIEHQQAPAIVTPSKPVMSAQSDPFAASAPFFDREDPRVPFFDRGGPDSFGGGEDHFVDMQQTESVHQQQQRPVLHVVSRQSVAPSESQRVRPKPQRDSFRNAFTIERMEEPVSSVVGRVSPPVVASLPSHQPPHPTRQQR